MKYRPIEHLSGRNYYKKKRYTVIIVVAVSLVAALLLFNFAGRSLRYSLHIRSGSANLEKGKITYAISEFNKALNLDPNNPTATDGLGSVYLKQGNLEEAKRFFDNARSRGLKSGKLVKHSKFGDAYLSAGYYPQAELEYRQAVALNPSDWKSIFGLAACMHAAGKVDESIALYNKVLEINKNYKPALKEKAAVEEDRNIGAIYYMYDAKGEPLARYNLINNGAQKTALYDDKLSHVTGFISDKRGKSGGVEKYFAEYLPGNKITLTIDMAVQKAVIAALGWNKGSIVVLNPKTGEILAMYSQPTFSSNNLDANEYWWNKVVPNPNRPMQNRAVDSLYEPGSIAKVVTVSAFLENAGNPASIFPIKCAGSTVLNGVPFWCWKKHGKVSSLEQTVGSSCNIGMKEVGNAAGGPKLSEYSVKFGFNTPLDLGIKDKIRNTTISWPVAQSIAPATPRSALEIAYFSCGLSSSERGRQYMITPLHAAMLAATIANKGVMMKPYLIKDIKNINGKPIYTAVPKELKKSITPETAEKISSLMVDTVDNGIGKKARVKGVTIAGKTGTSGKSGELNAWFITFAPAEDPQYAIAIIGEKSGTGMDVAAPIAADIYKVLFK